MHMLTACTYARNTHMTQINPTHIMHTHTRTHSHTFSRHMEEASYGALSLSDASDSYDAGNASQDGSSFDGQGVQPAEVLKGYKS